MNGKKVFGVLRNKFSLVCASALALFTVATGSVFAQETTGQTISLPGEGINWSGTATGLMTQIMTPVIVAIGIGLALWVMWIGFKLIRRAA